MLILISELLALVALLLVSVMFGVGVFVETYLARAEKRKKRCPPLY